MSLVCTLPGPAPASFPDPEFDPPPAVDATRAEVVLATCVGCDHPLLGETVFDCVVVDEATQAPDPIALVALVKKAEWKPIAHTISVDVESLARNEHKAAA